MKEYPILFSSEMVRAILEGKKTQTRRIIKPQPFSFYDLDGCDRRGFVNFRFFDGQNTKWWPQINSPFGGVGDRLWVRETFYTWYRHTEQLNPSKIYAADYPNKKPYECKTDCLMSILGEGDPLPSAKWKPSIHMPRWASRITLEIDEIRVERLQDITEEDARMEGVPTGTGPEVKISSYRWWFKELWDQINGKEHPWNKNEWVWVIKFHRIEAA